MINRLMHAWVSLLIASFVPNSLSAGDFKIESLDRTGLISWTNAFSNGVCTVEVSSDFTGWMPLQNCFTSNSAGHASISFGASNSFYRLLAVDLSTNTPEAYTNLLGSYGTLTTIAGNGFGSADGSNYWRSSFEGDYATNAALSRPHFAMADGADNDFIVDKDSHSVLKITPDGRIHTVAGTHVGGFNGDGPAPGVSLQLNFPNGLWVRADGTIYIVDTGNSKVRRLDTNGIMSTLFTVGSAISTGRGLWVKDDESLTFFCSGSELRKHVPGNTSTLNNNFNELANIVVNADGNIIATDRGANKVYLVNATGGSRSKLFGNGATNAVVDGTFAATNAFYGVRGVWPFPTGGYLLATKC